MMILHSSCHLIQSQNTQTLRALNYKITYFVTLNILNNRRALRTDSPNEPDFTADHTTSKMDPHITTQSKRLNADSK